MMLTIDQHPNALEHAINHYVSQGFYLLSQTETSAQLIRKKQFSLFWAVFWLIIGIGIGLLIYALIYMGADKEQSVYLILDASGKVKRW